MLPGRTVFRKDANDVRSSARQPIAILLRPTMLFINIGGSFTGARPPKTSLKSMAGRPKRNIQEQEKIRAIPLKENVIA